MVKDGRRYQVLIPSSSGQWLGRWLPEKRQRARGLNPFFIRSMVRTWAPSRLARARVLIPSSSGQWLGLLGSFFSFRDNGLQRGVTIFWATKKFSPRPLPEAADLLPAQRRPRGARRWEVAGRTRGNGHGITPYTLAADGREARFHQRAAGLPAAAFFHHTISGCAVARGKP